MKWKVNNGMPPNCGSRWIMIRWLNAVSNAMYAAIAKKKNFITTTAPTLMRRSRLEPFVPVHRMPTSTSGATLTSASRRKRPRGMPKR